MIAIDRYASLQHRIKIHRMMIRSDYFDHPQQAREAAPNNGYLSPYLDVGIKKRQEQPVSSFGNIVNVPG